MQSPIYLYKIWNFKCNLKKNNRLWIISWQFVNDIYCDRLNCNIISVVIFGDFLVAKLYELTFQDDFWTILNLDLKKTFRWITNILISNFFHTNYLDIYVDNYHNSNIFILTLYFCRNNFRTRKKIQLAIPTSSLLIYHLISKKNIKTYN